LIATLKLGTPDRVADEIRSKNLSDPASAGLGGQSS
jgi:hypothetical protein